mgnify:CR=1 FL=1
MPVKTWTTQTDFQEWTLTNLVATADGTLELAEGASSGTAVSPVFEALNWQHWSHLTVQCERPAGTNVYLRVRSGQTADECQNAEWSEYINGVDQGGAIRFDLRTYFLNNPAAAVGPFLQIELTLEAE